MMKINITVCISAYNESLNIVRLLKSILGQKRSKFILDEIILISDGSSDNTVELAKSIKSKKINIINSKVRIGQNRRYMQLLKHAKSEYVLFIEGDLLPVNEYVFDNLASLYLRWSNQKIGVVSGSFKNIKSKNLYQNVMETGTLIKENASRIWNGGDNVYWLGGHSLKLMSRELGIKINLPADVPEDAYIYLSTKEMGFKFIKSTEVNVYSGIVSNFTDQKKQSTKFITGINSMKKYFGADYIEKEYRIPFKLLAESYVKVFINRPVYSILYLVLHLADRFVVASNDFMNPLYSIYESSKNVIVN